METVASIMVDVRGCRLHASREAPVHARSDTDILDGTKPAGIVADLYLKAFYQAGVLTADVIFGVRFEYPCPKLSE